MATIDFVNIGDVLEYEFATGILQSINFDDDTGTALVNGAVIPVVFFYHCQSGWDSWYGSAQTIRANGALSGSAYGFVSNYHDYYYKIPATETVVIMKKKDGTARVVGYRDGWRECYQVPTPVPPIQE